MMTIPIEHERELYGYINGIIKNSGCKLFRIGGMPDHIHMLVSIPTHIKISDFVKTVKLSSQKWLKANPHFNGFMGWGEGYAVFSYGRNDFEIIRNYIINQKKHHVSETFANEYRRLIIENGGEINEQYFLRDD